MANTPLAPTAATETSRFVDATGACMSTTIEWGIANYDRSLLRTLRQHLRQSVLGPTVGVHQLPTRAGRPPRPADRILGGDVVRRPSSAFWHVLVTGGRDWDYPFVVYGALHDQLVEHGHIVVVHGDCPTGADFEARRWAMRNILTGMRRGEAIVGHEAYPAYWDELGKSAGPIRNKYMVDLGADICLAFPTPASRGTISCMDLATAAGIPVLNYGTPREGYENAVQ
jgi:hypothetical protein